MMGRNLTDEKKGGKRRESVIKTKYHRVRSGSKRDRDTHLIDSFHQCSYCVSMRNNQHSVSSLIIMETHDALAIQ